VIWRIVLAESIASLRFYRRRTLVTVFSLAWGVASFVILMSYGHGFDKVLESSFHAVGQDLIIMADGQTSLQAGGLRSGRKIWLDLDDVEAILAARAHVRRHLRQQRLLVQEEADQLGDVRVGRLVVGEVAHAEVEAFDAGEDA